MESKRLKTREGWNEGKSDQNERAYANWGFFTMKFKQKTSHWLRLVTLSGYFITVSIN